MDDISKATTERRELKRELVMQSLEEFRGSRKHSNQTRSVYNYNEVRQERALSDDHLVWILPFSTTNILINK